MKIYKYKMSAYLKSRIFVPCRSKSQAMTNLIDTARELLIYAPNSEDSDLIIVISKYQRAFYLSENKIYSTNFPFKIHPQVNTACRMYITEDIEITSKLLSSADSIINAHLKNSDSDFDSFFTSMVEELEIDDNAWIFLREIFMLEDGYIRYDIDPKRADDGHGEKELKIDHLNPVPITHPLHHIDIFYSPEHTFKIGLKDKIGYEIFLDIIDPKTKCRMLEE